MAIILASTNRGVSLGPLLNKGGEGSVFILPSMRGFVAKTYYSPLEPSQQRKLKYMVGLGDQEIFSHTAWPTDCLLSADRQTVVGFVMHHIHGMTPLHTAYNAKSRLERFPTWTWEFLLRVARNTAAAFETVHSRGHIVGDINETNILVSPNTSVRLLDCDSFQISANGEIHSCRVGVSAFTPPELQSKSFADVRRTSNHDCFGLAVIIFHLLFNGRHPFAGRPLRADVGGEPAANIAAFRFAYADDNAARGLGVPPKASPLTLVPAMMRPMFHRAFTENALKFGRPTAAEWLEALDECLDFIEQCKHHAGHVFPGHHDKCPWCELDSKGLKLFPHQGKSRPQRARTPFDLKKWHARLKSVSMPSPIVLPSIATAVSGPSVVYPSGRECFARTAIRVVSLGALLWIAAVASVPGKAIAACCTISAWWAATSWERKRYAPARSALQARLATAKAEWAVVQQAVAGQADLERLRSDLLAMRIEHVKLDRRSAELKRDSTQRNAARLLREHLIQCHVATADVPGITKANREMLQGYSIWNAYDVSAEKLFAVPGFGRVKVAAMLHWRLQCEASFCPDDAMADPTLGESGQWKATHEELARLEGRMRKGLRRLQEQLPRARENREHLQRRVDRAARELGDAQRESAATVYLGDWQAVAGLVGGWAARHLNWPRKVWPTTVALGGVAAAACIVAAAAYSLVSHKGREDTGTPTGASGGGKLGRDPGVLVIEGLEQNEPIKLNIVEPPTTKKAAGVVAPDPVAEPKPAPKKAPDPVAKPKPAPEKGPDPVVLELQAALRQVKRVAAEGNSVEAITQFNKAFNDKESVSEQYFSEWRDLILACREAYLQEARRNWESSELLSADVVRAERNATNVLHRLMRRLIKRGEEEQATKVFTQAKNEYQDQLKRVEVAWKSGRVASSMNQEKALLLEYEAMLHRDFSELRGGQQDLATVVSKYRKCLQFRLAFLKSDPETERVQKALAELESREVKKNGR